MHKMGEREANVAVCWDQSLWFWCCEQAEQKHQRCQKDDNIPYQNYEFNNWEISSSAYWQMNKDQDFLAWLHDGTKAGNLLIFYYSSGHGGSVKDKGGKKNMDKYLCLVDYQETG